MALNDKVVSEIIRQFNEEIGEDNIVDPKENMMLRQKYGLSAPQLTPSEKYLSKRDERE